MAKNRSEGHFRLSNLFSYNAPVVLTFSVISLVVLLLNERLPVDLNRMLFSVYRTSFRDPLMYVRVFTHVLGHADMAHFSQNICLLLVIGPIVEEKYGSRNLLLAMDNGFCHGCSSYGAVSRNRSPRRKRDSLYGDTDGVDNQFPRP